MKTMSKIDIERYTHLFLKDPAAANRYWARCTMARDEGLDVETVEKLKGFLKNKLSAEDHEQVCNMLAGDVEAQDTEPPPNDVDATPRGQLAGDAKARDDFYKHYPDAAKIRIGNSGIPLHGRAANYSAAGAKSFAEMFPEASRIKLA